jgi:hypothetical protein
MVDNFELNKRGAKPEPTTAAPSSVFQVFAGLTMIIALLVAAMFVGRYEATAVAATPAPAAPAPAPETPAPSTEAIASDLQELKAQVGAAATQIKQLQETVEGLPKPAPPPDVKSIQDKLDGLATSVAAALPLVSKVDTLGERFGNIEKQVQGFAGEIQVLKQTTEAVSRKSAR